MKISGTSLWSASFGKIKIKKMTTNVTTKTIVMPKKKILVTGYGVTTTATLAAGLARSGALTSVLSTGSSPTDTVVATAVAAAQGQDVIVVTTYKAWNTAVVDPRGGQQQLVAALRTTGKPVVVVAVGDAYDIAYLADTPAYLVTYSSSPVALAAAARVIAGELAPSGSLPVDIPVAGDPSQVLYPFGHGLGY